METGPDISGTELLTGGVLTALVRRPQPLPNGKPHPVLVMLHGFGANESDIYELVPYVDNRVLVVAARGPFVAQDNPRGSYKWYDWAAPGQILPELWNKSLELLATFVGQIAGLTGVAVDPTQVYIGGFSQGGAMSLGMAAHSPQLLAGILPHSAFAHADSAPKLRAGAFRGKPAFVAHGTEDQVLKIEMGRQVRDILQEGGVEVSYREYPIAHATSVASRQDLADWLDKKLNL